MIFLHFLQVQFLLLKDYEPINSPPNRNGLKKLNEYRSKVS